MCIIPHWKHQHQSLWKKPPAMNTKLLNSQKKKICAWVNANTVFWQQTANHITLIWCQEVIYENASCSVSSETSPDPGVDTKPIWPSKHAYWIIIHIITAQWALVPSCRCNPGSLQVFKKREVFGRSLSTKVLFDKQNSVLFWLLEIRYLISLNM